MTAGTLETYRKRVSSLLKDYERYGIDPTKMANWSRPLRNTTGVKRKKPEVTKNINPTKVATLEHSQQTVETSRLELTLRPGIKAIILVPSDITKPEVQKIRSYIDFLDSIAPDTKSEAK